VDESNIVGADAFAWLVESSKATIKAQVGTLIHTKTRTKLSLPRKKNQVNMIQ
jgi:hypothetical protein